jgi:hypothetical protein
LDKLLAKDGHDYVYFILFKRSDEGEFCGALAGAFVMAMVGDHSSHFLSTFSLSRKMLPFVARIPGDGGVAKAIPPMTERFERLRAHAESGKQPKVGTDAAGVPKF